MTTPTQHGQVPEALIDLIDAYAETRHRCGGIYNARTEAARKAVIEALSEVQALSAAPAPAIGDELRDTLVSVSAAIAEQDDRAAQKMIGEILAASPTPPAEQQAPATEGYVQPVPDKCDRITWRGRYYHLPLTEQAAPNTAPSEGGDETDWYHGMTEKHFDRAVQKAVQRDRASRAAAPKAAPGEPVKQTVREQIAAEVATQPAAQVEFLARYLCERDSINPDQMLDYNPVRLAWHREDLNAARLLAKLAELAPQQEAQEPVAWLVTWAGGVHNYVQAHASELPAVAQGRRMGGTVTPLYTAPLPAPGCHHRPPCAECAALAAQGGKV